MKTIRSVYTNQEDILNGILDLYIDDDRFFSDVTYGNGVFYKNIPEPDYKFDLEPQCEDVIELNCHSLPWKDSSAPNIVYDPPFLTYIKKGREHGSIMADRFSGYWRYDELEEDYKLSLTEFHRVLKHKGILVFKCQDIIHNHKMHCTHYNVINWAQDIGFRLKDLFILSATHRMPSPQKGKQKHARIYHSYFLVLENWKK